MEPSVGEEVGWSSLLVIRKDEAGGPVDGSNREDSKLPRFGGLLYPTIMRLVAMVCPLRFGVSCSGRS